MKTSSITTTDIDILARTIYGEARGEFNRVQGGISSFMAVANVVVNRLQLPQRFGKSIAEVCQKKWQFSCWNQSDPNYPLITALKQGEGELFEIALLTAEKVALGIWPDVTRGSNHYYATSLRSTPQWAQGHRPQIRIGHHIFYRIVN